MASVKIVYVEDINCPVCFEIFKTPVLLSCSHSICKDCLQQFWKNRDTQDCPICRRTSSRDEPLCNLVLKNLCESITAESASGSEEVCSLHNEKLKLFCLDDKQPVCIVCRDQKNMPVTDSAQSMRLFHLTKYDIFLLFPRNNKNIIGYSWLYNWFSQKLHFHRFSLC